MDMECDLSDIQVFDWKSGGVARPVTNRRSTSQRFVSSEVPTSSSRSCWTNGDYVGPAATSYAYEPYASSSNYGSSSYASESTSQYCYNYSTNTNHPRVETATSETNGRAEFDWLDFSNIEEVDYSKSVPGLDVNDQIGHSNKSPSYLDDVEEIDYSNPSSFNLTDFGVQVADVSSKTISSSPNSKKSDTASKSSSAVTLSLPLTPPPPPRLSANGVEMPMRSPVVNTLVVPKSNLPLSDIMSDGAPKAINGLLSVLPGDCPGRKRKRGECDNGIRLTQDDNDLVDLLGKSRSRVSSRMYAKPTRKAGNGDIIQSPSTDKSSRDDSDSQDGEDSYPILRIRKDIFEVDEDDD